MCHRMRTSTQFVVGHRFLHGLDYFNLMVRKSGKWKCLSFIKNVTRHTISGGADVVKPISSHDIQYEGTGNNDNSEFCWQRAWAHS